MSDKDTLAALATDAVKDLPKIELAEAGALVPVPADPTGEMLRRMGKSRG